MNPVPSTSSAPVLVCFAVREEARFFSTADFVSPVVTLITGMGTANAAAALQAQLARDRPRLVITCGFAGGLRPGLSVGSLVFSADHGHPFTSLLSELGATPGTFHSATRVAITSAEKKLLRDQTGADAVEMESGIIRQLCNSARIPSVTLRVISDPADQDLPLDFNTLMTSRLRLNYLKLAWALLRSPSRIKGLLQLQRQTQAAARRLGQALERLLRDQERAAG
jgi:adenosylhomocysteine nucleosidase